MNDATTPGGCARVRDRMPHLVDGTLPALQAARDEGHLEACAGCRGELESLELVLSSIREAYRVPAAELAGLELEILGSLPEGPRRRQRVPQATASWGWAAAAAVLLACAWKLTQETGLTPVAPELTGLHPLLARLPGWTEMASGLDHLSHLMTRG